MWAAYQRTRLKKEKLWAAVVTERPTSGSDDKKSDPVVESWEAMNGVALATIQMSVKLVHLNTVTSVDAAKEAWDALKVMFEARDNAQLLRLMDELSNLKKGDDENIIKFASPAKMIRDKLAMLGNPVDDSTLALRVLSGPPLTSRSTFARSLSGSSGVSTGSNRRSIRVGPLPVSNIARVGRSQPAVRNNRTENCKQERGMKAQGVPSGGLICDAPATRLGLFLPVHREDLHRQSTPLIFGVGGTIPTSFFFLRGSYPPHLVWLRPS